MEHLYICDTFIEYVKVKKLKNSLKILNSQKIEMERGVITNGFIIDKEEFINILSKLLQSLDKRIKGLNVLIDTNGIVLKKINIPKDVRVNIDKFVKLGFKDIEERDRDYLYCYKDILDAENNRYLFSSNVEKDKIESYIDIFNDLKIKIKSLGSANNTIVNCILSQSLSDKSFSFIYLFNDILNICFFEKGINVLNFRTRIFETDKDEIENQIIDNIVNTLRFTKTKPNIKFKVYSVGISENIISKLSNQNIELNIINEEEDTSWKYAYLPFNTFIKNKNRLNYYKSYHDLNKIKINSVTKLSIIGCGILFSFLIGLASYLKYTETNYEEDNLLMTNELNYLQTSDKYREYKDLVAKKYHLESKNTNIDEVYSYITGNINYLRSSQLSTILSICNQFPGLSISNYTYNRESNIFTLTGYSEDITGPLKLSKLIRESDVFIDVMYNLKEQDMENSYYFNIDCQVFPVSKELIEEDGD